jgi:hypothetical protein
MSCIIFNLFLTLKYTAENAIEKKKSAIKGMTQRLKL